MLKFNISASSLKLYHECPLCFYYQYIKKEPADTFPTTVYGVAGNILHTMMEKQINGEIWDEELQFYQLWKEKELDNKKGFNNSKLDPELYMTAVRNGLKTLREKYNNGRLKAEEKFLFPLKNDEYNDINLKGFIDVTYQTPDGEVWIIDWKTNSKRTPREYEIQAKMYFLLYYKKYNILPTKAIFEYVKINEVEEYKFTLDEILNFYNEIIETVDKIIYMSNDIGNWDLGKYDSPFNQHRIKCEREKSRREDKRYINVVIKNNRLIFDNTLPSNIKEMMIKKYSYEVEGAKWSKKYQSGQWDGRKKLFVYNSLPLGLINNMKQLLVDYNKYYYTAYEFKFFDNRDKIVMNKKYTTIYKETNRKLRDYQEDAINKMLEAKIGIMYMGTGLGKTFTAFELIKKINKRTLFIVNRLELVEQVHEDMENTFGMKCGKMSEGNLDINNQITVASIQTIYSIIKRQDETSRKLNVYLYNVGVCIWDEAQNVSNNNDYYKLIRKKIINAEYIFGLTGTPFRNGNDTLEMNALVGFPVVSYPTKWGEEHGWLVPTKCYFIKYKYQSKSNGMYSERYDNNIVKNDLRNKLILQMVEKLKNKKILILVKSIEHGAILRKLIEGSEIINSTIPIEKRKKIMKDFKEDKLNILIAGIKIAGAGLDIPSLDGIIIASAHKSLIDTIQTIGRVKRKYNNKKYGYLFDFVDPGDFYLSSRRRYLDLKDFGNEVQIINNLDEVIIE